MIRDATNAFWENVILFPDTSRVWPKTVSDFWSQQRYPLFGTEDAVDIQAGEGVCQAKMDGLG